MPGEERYVIGPYSDTPHLWDVVDTMRGGEVVLGGEALSESQARELAERLNRYYRDWRRER
jgi:hypothetical protein